jgi:hypothetical protein
MVGSVHSAAGGGGSAVVDVARMNPSAPTVADTDADGRLARRFHSRVVGLALFT